ncbi:MAG: hypothetical protein ACE5GA_10395, partial [Candidatus Zixiibacteriota bacterium]
MAAIFLRAPRAPPVVLTAVDLLAVFLAVFLAGFFVVTRFAFDFVFVAFLVVVFFLAGVLEAVFLADFFVV